MHRVKFLDVPFETSRILGQYVGYLKVVEQWVDRVSQGQDPDASTTYSDLLFAPRLPSGWRWIPLCWAGWNRVHTHVTKTDTRYLEASCAQSRGYNISLFPDLRCCWQSEPILVFSA